MIKANTRSYPPSKFGLVRLQERVRPEVNIKTRGRSNDVNGEIEAPILIIDRINSDLERVLKRTKKLCLTHL
jgi:ribonuclease G